MPGSAVSDPGWKPWAAFAASVTARSTRIPGGHMKPYTTQRRRCITRMQEKSTQPRCRISTLFAEASLAKVFQSLGDGEASQIPEDPCSLKSLESLKPKDLAICSLRTFPACCRMTKAGRFKPSSLRWMSWGTMSRGRCLTAKISAFPNPAIACTLSDILEENVPARYLLSTRQVRRLFPRSASTRKEAVSTTSTA